MTGADARLKLTAVAALCLASLALFSCDTRFTTVESAILPNLEFDQGFRHWLGGPGVVAVVDRGRVHVVLGNTAVTPISLLVRNLPDPQRFSHVRVGVEIRVEDIRPGSEPWQRAGVILRSLDRSGHKLWYWPFEVALLDGTVGWRRYQAVFPVGAEVSVMRLFIYQAGMSGRMAARHITLDAVEETRASKVARMALVFLWLAAGVWILAPIAVRHRRHPPAYLAALAGATILVLVLTPQPHLANAVKAVAMQVDRIVVSPPGGRAPGSLTSATGETAAADEAKALAEVTGVGDQTTPIRGPVSLSLAELRGKSLLGFGVEEFGHLAVYTGFAFIVFLGFPGVRRSHMLVYLLTTGVTAEVLQVFIITRTEHPVDGAMNLVGVLMGSAGFLVWRRFAGRFARPVRSDA